MWHKAFLLLFVAFCAFAVSHTRIKCVSVCRVRVCVRKSSFSAGTPHFPFPRHAHLQHAAHTADTLTATMAQGKVVARCFCLCVCVVLISVCFCVCCLFRFHLTALTTCGAVATETVMDHTVGQRLGSSAEKT